MGQMSADNFLDTHMNRLIRTTAMTLMSSMLFICIKVSASDPPAAPEKPLDPKKVAEELFKKCMGHAKQIRDEQVCIARKPAIEQCMEKESKAKDVKAAKTKCELMYLP
jgi:hypothetical protein